MVGIEGFELSLVYGKLYHVAAGRWNKFCASCLFLSAVWLKMKVLEFKPYYTPILKPSESHPLLHLQIKSSGVKYSFSETAGL